MGGHFRNGNEGMYVYVCVCVCMCVFIYHIHMRAYIHDIHICINQHAITGAYPSSTYTYIYVYIRIPMYIHAYNQVPVTLFHHVLLHAYMHTYIHTHIHTHVHTYNQVTVTGTKPLVILHRGFMAGKVVKLKNRGTISKSM
jgi:hypothetical protein